MVELISPQFACALHWAPFIVPTFIVLFFYIILYTAVGSLRTKAAEKAKANLASTGHSLPVPPLHSLPSISPPTPRPPSNTHSVRGGGSYDESAPLTTTPPTPMTPGDEYSGDKGPNSKLWQQQGEEEQEGSWPRVSVIMPVKGVRKDQRTIWDSRLSSTYPGQMELIFALESRDDPAYEVIQAWIDEVGESTEFELKIVTAGLTFRNSQKIANMLEALAAMSPKSKYVLFLDDEVNLYRGSIGLMVTRMMAEPDIFVVTGYPLDTVDHGAGMAQLIPTMIRAFTTVGFANEYPDFIWGGCMMMQADTWRNNTHSIVDIWRQGCYSDDMSLVHLARHKKLKICCPPENFFLSIYPNTTTYSWLWRFQMRQLVAGVSVYSTEYGRVNSRSLKIVAVLMPAVAFAPVLPVCIMLSLVWTTILTSDDVSDTLATWYSPSRECAPIMWPTSIIPLFFVAYMSAQRLCLRRINDMINVLTSDDPDPARAAPWKLILPFWRWPIAVGAYLVTAFFAGIWACFITTITWGNIRYTISKGVITKVEHPVPGKPGQFFTKPLNEDLVQALLTDHLRGFASHNPPSSDLHS